MSELTYIEAFVPLGCGKYVTVRGAVRMSFSEIEGECDDRLAVRFSELDENGDHIPGVGRGFTRGYDRVHDYRASGGYFFEDVSSLDKIGDGFNPAEVDDE